MVVVISKTKQAVLYGIIIFLIASVSFLVFRLNTESANDGKNFEIGNEILVDLDYDKDTTYYYLFNKVTEKTEAGSYIIDGAYAETYYNNLSFLFYANPLKFSQQLTFFDEDVYSNIISNTMTAFLLNEQDGIIDVGSLYNIIEALPVNQADIEYSNVRTLLNGFISY